MTEYCTQAEIESVNHGVFNQPSDHDGAEKGEGSAGGPLLPEQVALVREPYTPVIGDLVVGVNFPSHPIAALIELWPKDKLHLLDTQKLDEIRQLCDGDSEEDVADFVLLDKALQALAEAGFDAYFQAGEPDAIELKLRIKPTHHAGEEAALLAEKLTGVPVKESPYLPLRDLLSSGLLWLINRQVFHPWGFELVMYWDVIGDDEAGRLLGFKVVNHGDFHPVQPYPNEEEKLFAVKNILGMAQAVHDRAQQST